MERILRATGLIFAVILASACSSSSGTSIVAPSASQSTQATPSPSPSPSPSPWPSLAPSPVPSVVALATPSSTPAANALHLVVIGDSIPHADFCSGCTGFVDQYGKAIETRTGRPVAVTNASRNDSAGLTDIEMQVRDDAALRADLGQADVIIVSVGANNALPDASTHATMAARYHRDWGCVGEMGGSVATYTRWLLATTATCRQATRDAYATLYDRIFSTLAQLRAGKPTVLVTLNTYDANFMSSDFLTAGLPQEKLDKLWPLMIDIYDRWNDMECRQAATYAFDCVDLYHAFNGPKGDQQLGILSVDGSHPSQQGNDLIASLLADLDTSAIDQ